jgi:hypothetical protein
MSDNRAVADLMRPLWLFKYTVNGLDYMEAQGVDIDRVMEVGR